MMMLKQIESSTVVPTHVQLEVTWRCNWRCVHCYQDDHTVQELSLEHLQRLFEDLSASGTLHVIVTGGEPLVRKDIFQILHMIRQYGMGITLYTNGQLIDESCADNLSKLIAAAEITILAGDESIHDALSRVPGSYHRAMKAVDYLIHKKVDVVVKTPILRPAYHTLKNLEKTLMKKIGVQWHVDTEICRSYSGNPYPLKYKLNFKELQEFFRDFPRFNPQSGYTADPGIRKNMCLAGRKHCFIDAMGNVYPCLSFKSASDLHEPTDNPSPKLGNIIQERFSPIWESSQFLKTIRSSNPTDFETCGSCMANLDCKPCMALNYEEFTNLFLPASAVCNYTKAAVSLVDPTFVPASVLKEQSKFKKQN